MNAVPILKDEINRKAFESIEFLINKLNAGAITPHQFGTGVDVLWMAVSGLVNEDIVDLITAGGEEAPIKLAVEKRVFIKGRLTVVVDRMVGDDYVYIKSYFDDGMSNTKKHDCGKAANARDTLLGVAAKLLATGYIEL